MSAPARSVSAKLVDASTVSKQDRVAKPVVPAAAPKSQTSNPYLTGLFGLGIVVLLVAGWFMRDDSNLSAQDGLGYTLGLVGGIAMLLLLLYPLRKHWWLMRHLGAVKHWFRIHMLLGILGPVMILFHANFSLGSINSNLALFCMLVVAGSGLIGRYFYTRIHYGLYGQRASLQALRSELKLSRGKLSDTLHLSLRNIERLKSVEGYALKRRNLLSGVLHMPFVTLYCNWMRYLILASVRRELRKQAQQRGWDKPMLHDLSHTAITMLRQYLKMLQRTAHFTFYERLFGIWHVVHLPLFIMLLISGVVHVFAVHSY